MNDLQQLLLEARLENAEKAARSSQNQKAREEWSALARRLSWRLAFVKAAGQRKAA